MRPVDGALDDFAVDERALGDYGDMITMVRSCGAKVIGLIPPVEQDVWDSHPGAYLHYYGKVRPMFGGDPIIDFNGPSFNEFRADWSNFSDGVHLSRVAARTAVVFLDGRLRDLGFGTPVPASSAH